MMGNIRTNLCGVYVGDPIEVEEDDEGLFERAEDAARESGRGPDGFDYDGEVDVNDLLSFLVVYNSSCN